MDTEVAKKPMPIVLNTQKIVVTEIKSDSGIESTKDRYEWD